MVECLPGFRLLETNGIIPGMLPHAADLRRGRFSETGRFYLVTTVVRERTALFTDFCLARQAIGALRESARYGHCCTLAFVLMPDHLHWLLQLENGTLSRAVGAAKAAMAARVNRARATPGVPLWQRGFHDHALRREDDLATIARYIVANPLRAGLVKRIGDYPHWDAVWLGSRGPPAQCGTPL